MPAGVAAKLSLLLRCEPGCDEHAHAPGCALFEPSRAIERLREAARTAEAQRDSEQRSEWDMSW